MVSAQLGGHVSPSTLSGHQMAPAGGPVDTGEWVEFCDDVKNKTYYWNRRANETVWQPPAGIEVVWVGTQSKEWVRYFWHKVARVRVWDLPPLAPG